MYGSIPLLKQVFGGHAMIFICCWMLTIFFVVTLPFITHMDFFGIWNNVE